MILRKTMLCTFIVQVSYETELAKPFSMETELQVNTLVLVARWS